MSDIPLKNVKPNFLNPLAQALRTAQDKTNVLRGYGVGHLGDLFFGPAADTMENAAHGQPPWKGKGMTTQLDPGLVDLAGFASAPVAAVKGLAKGGQKMVSNALRKMPETAPNTSRRKFIKNAGVAAGVATVAASIPAALKVGAKVLGKGAAATPAAINTTKGVATDFLKALLSSYKQYGTVKTAAPKFDEFISSPTGKSALKEVEENAVKRFGERVKDAKEGFGRRYLGILDEGDEKAFVSDKIRDKLSQQELWNKTDAAYDLNHKYLLKNPDGLDLLDEFTLTGKWPKDTKEVMKWYDPQIFGERYADEFGWMGPLGKANVKPRQGWDDIKELTDIEQKVYPPIKYKRPKQ